MKRLFNFNLQLLVGNLLPTFLRTPRILAILFCLLEPLRTLAERREKARAKNLNRLDFTPQVCKIQKVLKAEFGAEFRVVDNQFEALQVKFAYSAQEHPTAAHLFAPDKPDFFFALDENHGKNVADFTVFAPAEFYENKHVCAVIDACKLPTKNYDFKLL